MILGALWVSEGGLGLGSLYSELLEGCGFEKGKGCGVAFHDWELDLPGRTVTASLVSSSLLMSTL